MKLHAWGSTDVGRTRDHNEDTYLLAPERGLFAVADGMGGHLGGDRASHMAVEILEREVARALANGLANTRNPTLPPGADPSAPIKSDQPPAPAALLRDATSAASTAIYDLAQADPDLQGMGTTLTTLFFHGERAFLGHVGDSRAFLYRDGAVRQLTDDHSWI